jgi:hypothetical protein
MFSKAGGQRNTAPKSGDKKSDNSGSKVYAAAVIAVNIVVRGSALRFDARRV